jgi:hypothetical protein
LDKDKNRNEKQKNRTEHCQSIVCAGEELHRSTTYKEDGSNSNSLIHSVYNIDGGLAVHH